MAWLDAFGDAITAGPSPAESGVLAPDVWHLWVGQAAPDDPHAVSRCLRSAAGADLVIARFASGQSWVGAALTESGRAVIPVPALRVAGDESGEAGAMIRAMPARLVA